MRDEGSVDTPGKVRIGPFRSNPDANIERRSRTTLTVDRSRAEGSHRVNEHAPIAATSDSVERFAADSQDASGSGESYIQAASRSNRISRSVLSEAFAGRQLPSARTLEAIARACNVDADPLLDRRDAIAEQVKNTGSTLGVTVSRKAAILLTASASF